jgi:cysteine desulfurase
MNSQENRPVYFDNNASTPPLPEVRKAVLRAMGPDFNNPSSAHSLGGEGKRLLAEARQRLADLLNISETAIYFSGSGTEANNWAIRSAFASGTRDRRLITTPIEHSSILKQAAYLEDTAGLDVAYIPVLPSGQVDTETLKTLLDDRTDLVSVQWVNNETGIIQPVEEIGRICREHGVPFHIDAAQAVGKLAIELSQGAADYVTLTGHKFHGPQGVGALIVPGEAHVAPFLHGGSQEGGLRAGTENMPGIVGLGKAAQLRHNRFSEVTELIRHLRDRFESCLIGKIDEIEVNGDPYIRVDNTSNLLFRGVEGQALMAQLDRIGIYCSQSSACTNSRPEPSYVLRAMGLSEDEAYASVRFSFSEQNTVEEVDWAVEQITEIVERLRAFARMGA